MTYRKDPEEKKEQFNIKIRKKLKDRIKRIPNYSPKVEKILEQNIDRMEKED